MTPSDEPHQYGSPPAGRTDEPAFGRAETPTAGHGTDPSPPVSVAQEAALLVDLLSRRGWPGSSGMPSGHSRTDGGAAAAAGGDTAGAHESRPHDANGPAAAGRAEEAAPSECTCGGTTPSACRVCPVCQVIAVVQRVSPDTIERVADFIGFAATALRELATAQRERQADRDESQDENDRTEPEGGA